MCWCRYRVEAPLNAVIHSRALGTYRQVFHLLWRMKRGEFVLSNAWRQHMTAATLRLAKKLPRLSQHLHACNLCRNRMWHFVQNLSNYMMFEVLEDAWSRLAVALDAAKDMDGCVSFSLLLICCFVCCFFCESITVGVRPTARKKKKSIQNRNTTKDKKPLDRDRL